MATHIEHEMNSCLTEMERLQTKMQELQQAKEEKAAEKREKLKNIEPNLAIMREWLKKLKERIEQDKMVRKYDDLMVKNFDPTLSNEERSAIYQGHDKYCQRGGIVQVPLFHNKKGHKHHTQDVPSEFMMNFIKSTYNMFLIQQQKIDKLEMELHA